MDLIINVFTEDRLGPRDVYRQTRIKNDHPYVRPLNWVPKDLRVQGLPSSPLPLEVRLSRRTPRRKNLTNLSYLTTYVSENRVYSLNLYLKLWMVPSPFRKGGIENFSDLKKKISRTKD